MNTKEKIKPISAEQKQLIKDADKVIQKIKDSGLRNDHIAEATKTNEATLSRFMNKKEGYITRSLVDRLSKYLEEKVK